MSESTWGGWWAEPAGFRALLWESLRSPMILLTAFLVSPDRGA